MSAVGNWVEIVRARIRRNLDRLAIPEARKAAILEAEVAKVVLATEAGEPLNESIPSEQEVADTQQMATPDISAPARNRRLPFVVPKT